MPAAALSKEDPRRIAFDFAQQVYPGSSVHTLASTDLLDGRGVLLLARDDTRPVGCGAIRVIGTGIGEVKRMFVLPDARRRGIGHAILQALGAWARDNGLHTLRLETGTRQPEALRLYATTGWLRLPPFGEYVGDAFSVCFEKRLG